MSGVGDTDWFDLATHLGEGGVSELSGECSTH